MSRLLYLSAHESLEAQNLRAFHNLGLNPFSVGHYTNTQKPIHPTRDLSDLPHDEEMFDLFCNLHDYTKWSKKLDGLVCGDLPPYVIRLKKDFVDKFDIIFITYYEENLSINWDLFKGKQVVLYCISQMQYHRSEHLRKCKTVHMSPKEHVMHGYKPNAVIRHAVDCDYYQGYEGGTNEVLTVNKWLKKRGSVSAFDFYEKVTAPFNRIAAGFGNTDLEYGKSDLTESESLGLRKRCGAYFSTCSHPGNITLSFIEALSMGCPMVSCGPKNGNMPGFNNFEAHEFIKQGINGFWSDDVGECQKYIKYYLDNPNEAKAIGANARKTAQKYFSLERAEQDWKNFFSEHMGV